MEIQIQEEFTTNIVKKGKRTKRQRAPTQQSSPIDETASASGSGDCLTEEDEDMANCLILLSQSRPDNNNSAIPSSYECKTCNKSFLSFQALGGHRASHKKLKLSPPATELDHQIVQNNTTDTSLNMGSVISLPAPMAIGLGNSNSNKINKVHECSICGAEFNSGQALGGHMRRHRPLAVVPLNIPPESSSQEVAKKEKSLLELDLNLPAPFDEDDSNEAFPFEMDNNIATPVGQPQLFRSSLVDCRLY